MSNNPTPATGVTGNTNIPQQQHAAAGSTATTNRIKSFTKNNKPLIGILALVAIYTIFVTFKSYGMGFGGLLVTLFLMLYAHKQYEKNSKPTVISLIGHIITAAIILTVVNSGPIQKGLDWLNTANAAAKSAASGEVSFGSDCPGVQEAKIDGVYTVERRCGTLRLTGTLPEGKIFDILEGGTGTTLEENIEIGWPYTNIHTVSLAPGKTGKVIFRIITAEESAELDVADAASK